MKLYFSKHYARLNNIDPSDELSIKSWYNAKIVEFERILKNIQVDIGAGKILEIGCGVGGFLHYLDKKGSSDFVGVDISEEQIEICRKYSTDKAILDDALNYLKKNVKYEYIFAFDIVEHIDKKNIKDFIKLCYNSLNKGGILVFRTPNMSTPAASFSRYIDFTHEVGFTEFSLKQIVSNYFADENISLFNADTRWKKRFAQRLINNIIEKIYDLPQREIITSNIYLKAVK